MIITISPFDNLCGRCLLYQEVLFNLPDYHPLPPILLYQHFMIRVFSFEIYDCPKIATKISQLYMIIFGHFKMESSKHLKVMIHLKWKFGNTF